MQAIVSGGMIEMPKIVTSEINIFRIFIFIFYFFQRDRELHYKREKNTKLGRVEKG